MAAGQRRKFTPEFKNEVVRLVLDTGRPVAEVARDIGVVEGTLGNWVNLWRTAQGAGEEPELNVSERAELAQLRRDNQTLRMEREFRKKPRPSSRRSRTGELLPACSGGEGQLPDRHDVPAARGQPRRLLRLDRPADFGPGAARAGAGRAVHQMCTRCPSDPRNRRSEGVQP